jgi:bifunctional non-homologous end joining protein LigD
MKKLTAYRKKRDFSKTAEPAGGPPSDAGGNRFVVHKHHATADHYDLRLEHDGVLKSWAVPKGPSLSPADKRLAVQTEDHPLEYFDFEDVIPQGEYGGGPMIVWDWGTWAPMDDVEKSLSTGSFKFRLSGEKLNGGWMLTRLKPKPGEKKSNWLLFKEHDIAADEGRDILAERPESVKTGRRIEELVAKPKAPAKPTKPVKLKPGAVKGAAEAKMPAIVPPQLADQTPAPPKGTGWLHEIKFDGYRTMAHIADGDCRLITRNGLDWTKRYGDIGPALATLLCSQAIVDGEVVALNEKGISTFAALQDALSQDTPQRLSYFAFDLIHLDGWDLRKVPLKERKKLLAGLVGAAVSGSSPIQLSDHVEGDGADLYERATELGLEGIVSKRVDAVYQSGRSKTWAKTKALQSGEFIIGGYSMSDKAEGIAALGLAEWADGELEYRGKVGTGFDAPTLADLLRRLAPLRTGAAPLAGAPKEILSVRPVLSARIHYANRTSDNSLRHAVFKGLREASLGSGEPVQRKRLISDADLATIFVTNPERRLFGKSGPTKLDIAVYYAAVGDFMLPHILKRPVSLFRCPTGRAQDCFFQRHAFTGMPASLASFDTKNSDGETKTYISVEDAKGYLALAQFGVVEFHAWGALRTKLDKPDRIVFDLDPGEGIHWREVVEGAVHVKGVLEKLGLVPFVKTTGGKGAHVVAPIKPRHDWKKVHQATSAIASMIAAADPQTFTTIMGKSNRKRLIFLDFHRNARSATWAAPYTLRARTHVAASTPLAWADFESIDAPEDLNYSSLPGLVATAGDPWAEIDDSATELPVDLPVGK